MRVILIALAIVAGLGATISGCAMPEGYSSSYDGNNDVWIHHRIPDGGGD